MKTQLSARTRNLGLLFLSIFIALIFYGCRNGNDGVQERPQQTYAMNVVVSQVPFWTESKETWNSLGQKFNVKTVYGGPDNDDAQRQINEIETLISQKVNGIVIAPTDSKALTSEINKAVDAGIPVVTYLVDAPDSKRLLYITSTLEGASKTVGEYAIKNNQPEGNAIILIGTAGSEEQERRANGFKGVVNNYPKMKVVDVIEDKFDASTGAQNLKASLLRQGKGKVKYIFGCNSRSAAAAKLALEELGYKPGEVVVTGWDYDDDVLSLFGQGWVYASAAQQSGFMSQMAFSVLYAYTNNYLYPPSLDLKAHGVSPVPSEIDIPINLITKDNAAAYFKKR